MRVCGGGGGGSNNKLSNLPQFFMDTFAVGSLLEASRRFHWAPATNVIAVLISISNNVIGACLVLENINVD